MTKEALHEQGDKIEPYTREVFANPIQTEVGELDPDNEDLPPSQQEDYEL